MSIARATIASRVVAFRKNDAVGGEAFRAVGLSPVHVIVTSQSNVDCVVSAYRINSAGVAGRAESSVTSTAVAAEATGYTGNGATLAFTGQALNNTPIVPKSVRLTPATSGVDLIDGGDGKFYTDDTDADEAGTIDYFTGDIILAYPAGKAPDGAIAGDYSYEDAVLTSGGRKTYSFNSLSPQETIVVGGACNTVDNQSTPEPVNSALVAVELVIGGDGTFVG